MLLLIPLGEVISLVVEINLQYTLLLLIPDELVQDSAFDMVFTIHFATINTSTSATTLTNSATFTIHFATINTMS